MYGDHIRRIHDHARLDRGLIDVCGKETERENWRWVMLMNA